MPLPRPVIVVPGITASYLRDDYTISPEIVWSVLTKDYERVILHPDDRRYELHEPAAVRPGQLFEIAYKELIEELRYNLSRIAGAPVPVYPFGYDWRQPLEATELQLERLITEVVERTRLMKHYHADGYRDDSKVNLLGHSMGGLVIAGYLERFGAEGQVDKVVSMASPFRGSLEAPLKIATGLANLGSGESRSRERQAARLTPALYHLLPSFDDAVRVTGDLPADLFDGGAWQPTVRSTLADFIAANGLSPDDPSAQAATLFEALLGEARTHRQRLEAFDLRTAGLDIDDWLCIVGVGARTRVFLEIETDPNGDAAFVIGSEQRLNRWDDPDAEPTDRVNTGDGTVPFRGAESAFIPPEKLVCVTPEDFGYWEVQDRALSRIAGFHGILPNMNMLHRMVVRFFTDGEDRRHNTWGRRSPELPPDAEWDPPLSLDEKAVGD